jgi:hypothetical protein
MKGIFTPRMRARMPVGMARPAVRSASADFWLNDAKKFKKYSRVYSIELIITSSLLDLEQLREMLAKEKGPGTRT